MSTLFVNWKEITAQYLVHRELKKMSILRAVVSDHLMPYHMYTVLLEDCPKRIITQYLTLIIWFLKIVGFDVFPYLLHYLRT